MCTLLGGAIIIAAGQDVRVLTSPSPIPPDVG